MSSKIKDLLCPVRRQTKQLIFFTILSTANISSLVGVILFFFSFAKAYKNIWWTNIVSLCYDYLRLDSIPSVKSGIVDKDQLSHFIG